MTLFMIIAILVLVAILSVSAVRHFAPTREVLYMNLQVGWFEVGDTLTLSDGNTYEIISMAPGSGYTEYRIARVKGAKDKQEAMLAT